VGLDVILQLYNNTKKRSYNLLYTLILYIYNLFQAGLITGMILDRDRGRGGDPEDASELIFGTEDQIHRKLCSLSESSYFGCLYLYILRD